MASYDYLDAKNDDGTVLGQKKTSLIGFWGITPVDQPDALTDGLTTITISAASAGTSVSLYDRCITAGYGLKGYPEAQTFMKCVQSVQIRTGELAARLVEAGILAGGTAAPTPTSYDFLGKGCEDDGSILGQESTDLISFWAVSPVDQPAACDTTISTTSNATVTTTISVSITATIEALVSDSNGFGWTSSDAAYSFVNLVRTLQIKLDEFEERLTEVGILATTTAGISITTSLKLSFLDKGNDDGTILGYASDQKIGFWGTTPVNQPSALTAAATTIETTIDGTAADYAIATIENTIGTSKFSTVDAANTVLKAVTNARTRILEIEAALEEVGLMAAG